jgi:hypothetical protein
MSNQTFKVVGITVHNGNAKVRFTDDLARRVKQFTKGGASRCDFIELPSEMNKIEALKFMLSHSAFQSAVDQATITDALATKETEVGKSQIKVKTKVKPSLESIKSRAKKTVPETTVEDILAVTE